MYFWFLLRTTCFCERFEPRSHFLSRLSMIVRVNVVLNRTVVVDSDISTTWAVVIFRVKVSCITPVDGNDTTHFDSEDDYTAQVVETTTVLFGTMFTRTIVLNLLMACFYCQYDLMFAGPKIPNPYWENNVWPMKPFWINVHTVRCRMVMPFVPKKKLEKSNLQKRSLLLISLDSTTMEFHD